MKSLMTFTIDSELREKLKLEKNQSLIINNLLKDYFGETMSIEDKIVLFTQQQIEKEAKAKILEVAKNKDKIVQEYKEKHGFN